MRHLPAHTYRSIKTATRSLLAACGPLKVAAGLSRIGSISTLQRFGSTAEADQDRFMPVDVALDLMAASEDITLLHTLAGALGYDVVRSAAPVGGSALSGAANAMGATGHLIADLSEVIKDGKITACEIKDKELIRDVTTVMQACSLLKTKLIERQAESEVAANG